MQRTDRAHQPPTAGPPIRTDRQPRIQQLQLRHREGAWSAALGWLFDNADGSLSTLPGRLSRDAQETMDAAYARHIRCGDALVAQMPDAR